jgi:hypothetical protein
MVMIQLEENVTGEDPFLHKQYIDLPTRQSCLLNISFNFFKA